MLPGGSVGQGRPGELAGREELEAMLQEARDVNCLEGGGCFVCAETQGEGMCSQKGRERKDGRERDMLKFDIERVKSRKF